MSHLTNTIESIFYLQVLERKLSFQPGEQNDKDHVANSSETEPKGPLTSRQSFVEAFLLEHSALGGCIASIEISGSF